MGNFLILMNIYINPIADIILKVEKLEDSQLISRNKARNHFFQTSNAIIVERKKWRENACLWIGKLRVVMTVILPDLSKYFQSKSRQIILRISTNYSKIHIVRQKTHNS